MRSEHLLFTIPLRLRSWLRWAQADQELDDEVRDQLERKTRTEGRMKKRKRNLLDPFFDSKRKVTPSELEAEANRLIATGRMRSLDKLLDVIADVRQQYRQRILDARHGVRRNRF